MPRLLICRYLLVLALLGVATAAHAANPSLGSISPRGAQRGTEIEVTFGGARLADAQEIMLYYPGISVKQLEVKGDNQVKTTLVIAPDCRLGIHAMRVRTASGISDLKTFSVGLLPEVSEKEPNNLFDQPQPMEMGVTINGVITSEDVDYFVVEARKGERISAEIEGLRLGMTTFDPYLAILDEQRFELARSDDTALVWQDCVASIVAPKDGRYMIQVRESSGGGNGNCHYRLHLGRFPRPTALLPAGGKPGETLQVKWLGDVLGEREETVTLPQEGSPLFGLLAKDETGMAPSANVFRINDLTNTIEAEPNNAAAEATPCTAPGAVNGVISQPGDVDCYKFSAKKGQVFEVRVYGRAIRSPLDSVLTITRIGGQAVGNNDDAGGTPDSYLRFNAPADDEYVISVRDHLGSGGADYAYRVELTPVEPRLTLGLPERQQYVDVTVSVPRGNRTALLVSAARADFGGELKVDINDMPAGLALETVPMAANQTMVPVLLAAQPEAALAGSLADVVGRPVDEKIKVEGHILQDTLLVRGQNNRKVWGHEAYRMALAVTEEAPFAIEVVQPKVPLVRNGAMALKVVAKRKEGFTAPIAVRMLYNPAGVGSASSTQIPEGQTEATIALNASAEAEIKSWKIAVMGEATVGNGPVLVSSQLANLEIAEGYFTFAFSPAAVEQGQETDVLIKITKAKDFEGPAKVELLGVPNEVTVEPIEITKDMEEASFKVKTSSKSPVGRHKTLLCRAVVMQEGEPITHTLGGGELRIDAPLPAKPAVAAAPSQPAAAAAKPAEKKLSRLEQLRLEREQAKKTVDSQGADSSGEAK
jgi:hypothetical protein